MYGKVLMVLQELISVHRLRHCAAGIYKLVQVFMEKIDLNNDRDVDFISIHCYPDNYGGAGMAEWFLEQVVDWTWEKYQKPIWVTEFSTTGPQITATGGNGTKEFWENVMPGLDARPVCRKICGV